MPKIYTIYLEDKKIGITQLEKGDAPMGAVFGVIEFKNSKFGYTFFKNYCKKREINLATNSPEDKLILTRTIPGLKVVNEIGMEIKGTGNQISGMDADKFEITIEGIAFRLYEEEFPHHVAAYENIFKEGII